MNSKFLPTQTLQNLYRISSGNTVTQWNSQHALKNVNNCLNTNICSYLETSGGQSSNLNLNLVHSFNNSVNKTSVAA
jgi:hypothetical protein